MKPCKKTSFHSETFAVLHIEKLRKSSTRLVRPIRTYLCPKCNLWHLTSKKSREQERVESLLKEISELNSELSEVKRLFNDCKQKTGSVLTKVKNSEHREFAKEEYVQSLLSTIKKQGDKINELRKEKYDLIARLSKLT